MKHNNNKKTPGKKDVCQFYQQIQTLITAVNRFAGNRISLFFYLLFFSTQLSAQFNVTIKLRSTPGKHKNDTIFIAGSFNGWKPDNDDYKIRGNSVVLKLNAGNHEFKFTRGTWAKVESNAGGSDAGNHSIQINSDTVLDFSIAAWKDDFPVAERKHTASRNVQLLSEKFDMPSLHRQKRIWVYLPPGYEKTKKRYPVMYMHDGQNVFDEYYAYAGEWGVDEWLDSLIANGKPGSIVVAIENGQNERLSEYNPFAFTYKNEKDSVIFPPKANEYLNDIVKTLKPFIDKKFRTLSSKENTIIAGSSMGGLISYYAVIKYPEVFGKAGIFSPAFWTASGIDSLTDVSYDKLKGKYFFYMGGKEGGAYVEDMNRIYGKIRKNSSAKIYSVIDPEALHNENYWRKWFGEFYKWIMVDGYKVITSPGN